MSKRPGPARKFETVTVQVHGRIDLAEAWVVVADGQVSLVVEEGRSTAGYRMTADQAAGLAELLLEGASEASGVRVDRNSTLEDSRRGTRPDPPRRRELGKPEPPQGQ